MATITEYARPQSKMKAGRDRDQNYVRDTVNLKTSDRVSFYQLLNMRPLPKFGDEHDREIGFYLDSIEPTLHAGGLHWKLELEFTPYKGKQLDPDPIARPADITLNTSLVEEPTYEDGKGNPTVNTAGQLINGIIRHVPLIEYTVKKNLATDPAWLQTHLGTVNQDVVTLRGRKWEPKTLMLMAASGGSYTTEYRTTFTEFTLTLMADARTWSQEVWNRGTVYLVETYQVIRGVPRSVWAQKKILQGSPPAPVDEPVFLDIDGQPILDHLKQTEGQNVDVSRVIKLNFLTQKEKTFSGVLPLK